MYVLFKCVRILGAFENLEATLYLYYFAQKIIKSDIWDYTVRKIVLKLLLYLYFRIKVLKFRNLLEK